MSGYDAGEKLWLARVRAVSGYDSGNTSQNDFGILNDGTADTYIVLFRQPGESEMIALSTRLDMYRTTIRVYQRYVEDGQTIIDLNTNINNILTSIITYPYLGDTGNTIQGAQITNTEEVTLMPADAPQWAYIDLIGEWHEETEISFAE